MGFVPPFIILEDKILSLYMAYTKSQINRIGNMLVYFTSKLGAIPKTKLLKLIYILEEEAVLKSGEKFTDLEYQYWTQGPVSSFINKQIDKQRDPIANFLSIDKLANKTLVKAKSTFDDSEFSNFDISLMDSVIERFGNKNTNDLIDYTHREGSLWNNKHKKHGGQPPLDDMELDLMEILNEVDADSDLKISAQEAIFFKDYLTNPNAQT